TISWVQSNGTTNKIMLGWFPSDASKYLVGAFDAATNTVSIEYYNGTSTTTIGSLVISAPAQNSVFEVSITGNSVAVHVAGNLILARDVSASLETRDKSIWTTYYFGFAMQSDGTANSMSVNNAITTGYSGIGQGIQDYRPVHDIYGNTYQDS